MAGNDVFLYSVPSDTGNDVRLRDVNGPPQAINYTLTCDAGAYTYTGNQATLSVARYLVCNAGSYAITGFDAQLNYSPGFPIALFAGGLRKHRKKQQDEERERIEQEQRQLLEEMAIAEAISRAEADTRIQKKYSRKPVTLEQIIGKKAMAQMDATGRISLEAKIQTVQRKQRQRREDDELMMLY